MGTEALWVPLLMSAASAGVGAYGANQVAQKQDKIAAQGIRQQSVRQREADALVNNTIRQTQESNPEGDRESSMKQYLKQLQLTMGNANGPGQLGGVSDRYKEGTSGAAADIAGYGNKYADIFSRLDAPNLQRQREAISFGRLASDINPIAQASQSDQFLTNMRIQGVRPNPWLQILQGGLAAGASGMSGSSALTKGGTGVLGGVKNGITNYNSVGYAPSNFDFVNF